MGLLLIKHLASLHSIILTACSLLWMQGFPVIIIRLGLRWRHRHIPGTVVPDPQVFSVYCAVIPPVRWLVTVTLHHEYSADHTWYIHSVKLTISWNVQRNTRTSWMVVLLHPTHPPWSPLRFICHVAGQGFLLQDCKIGWKKRASVCLDKPFSLNFFFFF